MDRVFNYSVSSFFDSHNVWARNHANCYLFNNFFNKSLLWGQLIRLFWTSANVFCGFQSQSEQHYLHLTEAYMCYTFLRFTIGATPADLLVASMAAQLVSSMYL